MTKAIILAALACVGCDGSSANEQGHRVYAKDSIFWDYLEYDGHEYVRYMPRLNGLGITHSPKCPCHNAKGADRHDMTIAEKGETK